VCEARITKLQELQKNKSDRGTYGQRKAKCWSVTKPKKKAGGWKSRQPYLCFLNSIAHIMHLKFTIKTLEKNE